MSNNFPQFDNINGYDQLAKVLVMAFDQAAKGKGKTRHSMGRPFDSQRMLQIARLQGTHNGLEYQVHKKVSEGVALPSCEARVNEFLGAINYLAGMVLFELENVGAAPVVKTEDQPKNTRTRMNLMNILLDIYYGADASHLDYKKSPFDWFVQNESGTIYGFRGGRPEFVSKKGVWVLCPPVGCAKTTKEALVVNAPLAIDFDMSCISRRTFINALRHVERPEQPKKIKTTMKLMDILIDLYHEDYFYDTAGDYPDYTRFPFDWLVQTEHGTIYGVRGVKPEFDAKKGVWGCPSVSGAKFELKDLVFNTPLASDFRTACISRLDFNREVLNAEGDF